MKELKSLKKALRPLRLKVTAERIIAASIAGIGVSSLVSAVILAVSKFVYIPALWLILCGVCAAVFLLSLLYGFVKRPDMAETAEIGDRLGFKQRLITTLEILRGNDKKITPVQHVLISDTLIKAQEEHFAKRYKIKISKKLAAVVALLLTASIITGFIPAANPEEIDRQANFHAQKQADIEKIEQLKKELAKKLSPEEAARINNTLEKLTEELKKASDSAETKASLQKAQEELKKAADAVQKDLRSLAEALARSQALKSLGESMRSGDEAAIQAAADALKEQLQNMSAQDREALLEELAALAGQFSENQTAKDALSTIAAALSAGDLASVRQSIDALSGRAGQSSVAAMQDAIADANERLSAMGQGQSQSQTQLQTGSQRQSGGDGEGQGEGQGTGQTQGKGQGNGQDEGQGGGQGQGAGQTQGGGGAGRGTGHVEDEMIYSRDAQGFSDYEANIEGTQNDGGETVQSEREGFGDRGESVPYREVYQAYKSEALRNLDDYEIPEGMRALIREYFSALD